MGISRVPALLKAGVRHEHGELRNVITQVWFPDESLRGHAQYLIDQMQAMLGGESADGDEVGRLLWIERWLREEAQKSDTLSHVPSEDGVVRSDPAPSMFTQEAK